MGFLSKLMKNPIVQMALPMALTGGASALFGGGLGAKLGIGSLFSGMNPLMANALKQTALGYGTAALSGSRRPGRAAMVAGLTSIPFSYMSAANAAKQFNAANAGATTQQALRPQEVMSPKNFIDPRQSMYTMTPKTAMVPTQVMAPTTVPYTAPTVTPMDVMLGRTPETMMGPSSLDQYVGNQADAMPGFTKTLNPNATSAADQFIFSKEMLFSSITFFKRVDGFESDFGLFFLCGLEEPEFPISSCPTILILRKFLTPRTKALFSAVAAKKLDAKL